MIGKVALNSLTKERSFSMRSATCPVSCRSNSLRVLEEKVIQPLGGISEIEVDVRIVAATHRDLEEMVSEGEFREDLLYRLNVLPIRIPPLSQRKEDIPELLDHFAELFAVNNQKVNFTRRSLLFLQAYSWPGNVRELSNLVQRFSVLYPGKTIELSKIPEEFFVSGTHSYGHVSLGVPL